MTRVHTQKRYMPDVFSSGLLIPRHMPPFWLRGTQRHFIWFENFVQAGRSFFHSQELTPPLLLPLSTTAPRSPPKATKTHPPSLKCARHPRCLCIRQKSLPHPPQVSNSLLRLLVQLHLRLSLPHPVLYPALGSRHIADLAGFRAHFSDCFIQRFSVPFLSPVVFL